MAHETPTSDVEKTAPTEAKMTETLSLTGKGGKQEDVLAQAQQSEQDQHAMSLREGLRIHYKSVIWSAFLSVAVIMEGYDAILLSSLFGLPSFTRHFGELRANGKYNIGADWQSAIPNAAKVGQFFGLFLAGWCSDRFGFRKTTMGTCVLIAGLIFMQFFAGNIKVLLAAQLLFGFPLGVFMTLTTVYSAEICPLVLRPYLTTWVNLCWTIGKLISAGVLRAFVNNNTQWAYRIPFATQWVWPPIIFVVALFAPESPWWFVRNNRLDEARKTLCRLRVMRGDAASELEVDQVLSEMVLINQHEMQQQEGMTYFDCFKGTNLRRTEIACVAWVVQPFCGFGIVGFATYFFQQAGLNPANAFSMSLGQQGISFVAGVLVWFLLPHVGRRSMYLYGLFASTLFQFAVGFLGIPEAKGSVAWATGSMLLFYVLAYNLSIGPTCYIIVSEMGNSRLRSKTTVLARNAYQVATIVNSILTTYMINSSAWNWRGKAGLFWGGVSVFLWIYCYFRLPETKDRTFGELDALFDAKVPARKFKETDAHIF